MSFIEDKQNPIACLLVLVVIIMITGCLRDTIQPDSGIISDRLINFLINTELPLGSDDSELRHEVLATGDWMRQQLARDPEQRIKMLTDNESPRMTSGTHSLNISSMLHLRLLRLNNFFVRHSAVPRDKLSTERMRQAVLHPFSIQKIQALIAQDSGKQYAELGGIVTIGHDEEKLYFLVVESDLTDMTRRLDECRDDMELARETLIELKDQLPYLRIRAERTIDVLANTDSENEKREYYQKFLELLLFYSRHSYSLTQPSQFAALAETDLPGFYIGAFHVHPPANLPSPEDRMASLVRKNLVIVPMENDFDVHYLDFSADPDPDPVVISYRKHSAAASSAAD